MPATKLTLVIDQYDATALSWDEIPQDEQKKLAQDIADLLRASGLCTLSFTCHPVDMSQTKS